MPGHLQEGFGCMVTNRFEQLFDHELDSFQVLKAVENKGSVGGPGAKSAAQAAAQTNSNVAGKQLGKESQKYRKNPLPLSIGVVDKKEETQPPVGEGKIIDRRPERFEKPLEEKGEGGKFSFDRLIIDGPIQGCGGHGHGMGQGDGFGSHGKCEFDRHSGSDRSFSHKSDLKHEDRHRGSESHNWETETPEGEEHHPVADTENMENEVEEVKEKSPKGMTFNAWKAIQHKDQAKGDFNIRKPNEGPDGQWKKVFVFQKSKSKEAHAEESVMDHHFLEANQFWRLGHPGRGRGGHGCGRHPNHGMLVLLMWMTQRHSQLWLNWMP
uniref:Hyaluronan/mRNA-binding protein domain-containing protein n=1 Tax=Cebus imitator TaxID=2715852 RepID=A0A2K5SJI7_CEBIM